MKNEFSIRYKEMWIVTGFIDKRCKERWLVEAYSIEKAIEQVKENLILLDSWEDKKWDLTGGPFHWDDEENRVWSCGFGDW